MLATAKIFSAGNSQAVRLPKAFRVDVSEMWITNTCHFSRVPGLQLEDWTIEHDL